MKSTTANRRNKPRRLPSVLMARTPSGAPARSIDDLLGEFGVINLSLSGLAVMVDGLVAGRPLTGGSQTQVAKYFKTITEQIRDVSRALEKRIQKAGAA